MVWGEGRLENEVINFYSDLLTTQFMVSGYQLMARNKS